MITGLHAQFVGIGFAAANVFIPLQSQMLYSFLIDEQPFSGLDLALLIPPATFNGDFHWPSVSAVLNPEALALICSLECVPAVIVLVGTFWLPYSPRWLLENDRDEEAYKVLKRLHGNTGNDESFLQAEFAQMRDQIRFEKSITIRSTKELFTKPNNRKRIVLAILVQVFTQLSGINVINYYQTDLYKSLGITGHTVTLLASIYGMVGPLANVICLYFVDSWGRRKTLWITGIIMAIDISLVMAMTASFSHTDNVVGKGFGIAFIFCFSIMYSPPLSQQIICVLLIHSLPIPY